MTSAETDLLRRAGLGPVTVWAPNSFIPHTAGEQPSPRYIISGWAARVRTFRDGRRQLVQVVLPGDALCPQLNVRHRQQLVQCLSQVRAVDGLAVRQANDPVKFPGIAAAIEVAAAHDRALLMNHAARLGRQSAYERVANLFMELRYRCGPIGLVHDDAFLLPMTQEEIGDLLGLSVVHVNRTLQLMRRNKMLTLHQGRLKLLDVPALTEIAEFDPPQLQRLA